MGEWTKKRHLPKEQHKKELEDYLQHALPANKPVVAFFQDEHSYLPEVRQALCQLAHHVNLIVKAPNMDSIPGAYLWPGKAYAPNLLRFAADYILTGYHSGTLASSTMLGLRAIPFYTNNVYYQGRKKGILNDFSVFMPGTFVDQHVDPPILDKLNPPVNLTANQYGVLERMEDKSFWQAYERKLPVVQKEVFGNYTIDDAPELTAKLLLKAFFKKSFGEYTAAIRLR